ncbi:TPA: DUF2313 domain-containing protein [Escherichia coli]|nr:DUF2313 domain-containing protein [Escherichia coli]HCG2937313.1 DUF2313 domain-containing protein [Escherichia coli]HCG3100421.1 DUF2313 domain-containing protein [Escherichia coli]
MNKRDLLASLLPPLAYSPNQLLLNAELEAEGKVFDTTGLLARQVLSGISPLFSSNLLADWERVLGLTPVEGSPVQPRQQRILGKLAETGGLSIPYFIRLAKGLGYTITIEEPRAFRAGVSRAGERLWAQDSLWIWIVNVKNSQTESFYFRAGISTAGDRVSSFGTPIIEEIFRDLKPAHTQCYFAYQDSI